MADFARLYIITMPAVGQFPATGWLQKTGFSWRRPTDAYQTGQAMITFSNFDYCLFPGNLPSATIIGTQPFPPTKNL